MAKKVIKRRIFLSRIKRKILNHVWVVRSAIILGIVALLYLLWLGINTLFHNLGIANYGGLVTSFVFTPSSRVSSHLGRTNILVMGKGGEGHEAPDLTDTIIFVSVPHQKGGILTVSIPRDIWVPSIRAKINSAYYWGNQKKPPQSDDKGQIVAGGGITMAASSVEEIVGQPIHYGLVIDFSGFKELVDVIGGIEVDVENSFTDNYYPIPGRENDLCPGVKVEAGGQEKYPCRYESVSFGEGINWMDGQTALKFVRSRRAEGVEGTDLARAKRQERVIAAIKNRMLSREVIFSPQKLRAIIDVAGRYLETNIPTESAAFIARKILVNRDRLNSLTIPEEYLINPPQDQKYDFLYVFAPRSGNWNEVNRFIGEKLN